jgi:F-type H+-transporting ATPase subunit epsilon
MELMKLEIVTPNGVIFDAEVKQVTLPGSEGEFGVLANHATLVSLLDTGVIVIDKADGSEVAVAINSGYVKVDEEKTTCIVDGAVALSGDDSDLAKALEEAKALLKSTEASNTAIAAAVSKVEQIGKSF